LEDCRIPAKSIAEQLGIPSERVGSVIHEDLDMLVACFLPGRARDLPAPLYGGRSALCTDGVIASGKSTRYVGYSEGGGGGAGQIVCCSECCQAESRISPVVTVNMRQSTSLANWKGSVQ
jgi:hypothetical protein